MSVKKESKKPWNDNLVTARFKPLTFQSNTAVPYKNFKFTFETEASGLNFFLDDTNDLCVKGNLHIIMSSLLVVSRQRNLTNKFNFYHKKYLS